MGSRFNILETIITVRTTKFNIQQDGQCNVTLSCVRVTLVAVEKQCVAYSECIIRCQP